MNDASFDRAAMQVVGAVRAIFTTAVREDMAAGEQLGRILALMAELRPDPGRAAPRR